MEKPVLTTDKTLDVGIDIGSTTTKVVAYSGAPEPVFREYGRHFGNITGSLAEALTHLKQAVGNPTLSILLTGSAGMGIAEKYSLPFVQELVAAAEFVSIFHPEVNTLIDIGGEDTKIIMFRKNGNHDIRMNGSCAGGTGAFLDQMVSIMNIGLGEFDRLAEQSAKVYPIASRCGVFAKTDVQNLLSREIPLPDIARSVYHALSIQLKNSLLKGSPIAPMTVFSGGPLSFLPNLGRILKNILQIEPNDFLFVKDQEYITASGAAVLQNAERKTVGVDELINCLSDTTVLKNVTARESGPLFHNYYEFSRWMMEKDAHKAERAGLQSPENGNCFIGIDSGSTTTKIVAIDTYGRIVFDFYRNNNSDPIGTVKQGLLALGEKAVDSGVELNVLRSAVTGYGEDLIKSAFDLDHGIVETLAHYRSAVVFDPKVSFILDIGGQDMKAIFVKDGIIRNIEINEACSSGCGSFIENFANSLNYSVEKFSELACEASNPCDLGTRCTVFMNSRVKQAFREGNEIRDISAGLAMSVVYNCLHKVLKIHDKSLLGDSIIVQGGTFRNPSVHKAFENILNRKVICPDISELMGAYGAALSALDMYRNGREASGSFRSVKDVADRGNYTIKHSHCKGCENVCPVSALSFENGNRFFTGNKCEKHISNKGTAVEKGINFQQVKYDMIFNRRNKPVNPPAVAVRIGIPRVLNFFENFPFWNTLFTECGFETVLSDKSSQSLYESGSGFLMSDNICYPAKLVQGHIINLAGKGVDRMFFPIVTHEQDENPETRNCFNCPIVTGYPDVIRSTINPLSRFNIPLDTPNITFKDRVLLKRACYSYFKTLGVGRQKFQAAFSKALDEQMNFRRKLKEAARKVIENARKSGSKIVVIAGRPYHTDTLINMNIPDIVTGYGISTLTEDCLPVENELLTDVSVITQWAYPNRIFKAAKWVIKQDNAEFVMINSFGCGPDTIAADEVKEILESYGKAFTLIRVDELNSTGSLKLRIRSMVESMKIKESAVGNVKAVRERRSTMPFTAMDRKRTILAPHFSPFHLAYIANSFRSFGYNFELLPASDPASIEMGLKYVNNEICYPATIVIGDILKALLSGKYDPDSVAVGLTQTGGQCRASNYIPLLKKAMIKAGFENVPVVAVTLAGGQLNYQPGFKINRKDLVLQGIKGLLFGDALSSLYHSTAAREKMKGSSMALVNKYNDLLLGSDAHMSTDFLTYLLDSAVDEFNDVETEGGSVPKIGVVGEVYVKNNPFGNNYIVNRLVKSGYEIIMPPLINMFIQWFVNAGVKHRLNLDRNFVKRNLTYILELYYNHLHGRFESVLERSRFHFPHPSIREIGRLAEPITNMANHYFGEGWMIAGDIAWMYSKGIKNVICLQPFGCLANHIVAKGIDKKLREMFPDLNVAFLDIDYGSSDVNLQNRIHLLLNNINRERKAEEVFVAG